MQQVQQIQQPMQYPGQITMIQPGVTVTVPPVRQVGVYGAQRMMGRAPMNQQMPSTNDIGIFNDD